MFTNRAVPVLLGLILASACFGQVKFTRETDVIHIEIDGKPFADYHYGADVARSYLAPVRAASGTMVTRQFPMVEGVAGETTDHRHHRGIFFGYKDLNGHNYWENELSYKRPTAGKIVSRNVKDGKSGALRATSDWIDPSGKTVLVENSTMIFRGDKALREIDFDYVLTAKEKAVFGDDKDGLFGIRLADALIEKKPGTGTMINSAGMKTMKEVWGKQADWIDYSGEINGEKVGVAIFDHPTSFRHPSRWHSRDYGLFSVNPLGSQTFDKNNPKSEVVLNPGEKLHVRYLVVIHPGLSVEKIGEMYKSWAAKK